MEQKIDKRRMTETDEMKKLREKYKLMEKELREKCGLKDGEFINTNLGLLDILGIGRDKRDGKDKVALGVLATGKIIYETVDSVLKKMKG